MRLKPLFKIKMNYNLKVENLRNKSKSIKLKTIKTNININNKNGTKRYIK